MSGFSLFGVNLSGAEYDPGGTREGTNYTYPSDAEIDYRFEGHDGDPAPVPSGAR